MSQYLPKGRFKWLKNVDKFDVNSISKKSPIWYIVKVYLEYPDELHKLHNDYQFLSICCEIIVKKLQTNMQ